MTTPVDDVATGDYLVPIYVDTGALMDVLASIEGGFTSLETVTSKTETASESVQGAGFSLSSALRFLKLELKGDRGSKDIGRAAEERSGERYYSPGSLLNRLRRHLRDNDLLDQTPRWDSVRPSQFIEFRGIFRPNPLTEALGAMKRIMDLMKSWPQFKAKRGEVGLVETLKMIEALLKDLEGGGRKLFVVEPGGGAQARVVAPVLVQYLRDQTQAELSHGDFRVTAKVVRRLNSSEGETIHLLPGTGIGSAGALHTAIVDAIQFGRDMGMKIPDRIDIEVSAPAVVVLPIGISV